MLTSSDLEILSGKKIIPGKTLLFLDEIQEAPKAITALKYFSEDMPELHIAAAGSLLGLAIHEGVSFPVGKVDELNLYPMSFPEFVMVRVSQTGLADKYPIICCQSYQYCFLECIYSITFLRDGD